MFWTSAHVIVIFYIRSHQGNHYPDLDLTSAVTALLRLTLYLGRMGGEEQLLMSPAPETPFQLACLRYHGFGMLFFSKLYIFGNEPVSVDRLAEKTSQVGSASNPFSPLTQRLSGEELP